MATAPWLREFAVTSLEAHRTFALDLIEQHWCGPESEGDPSQAGRLRVVINGVVVMDGAEDDTGVARSALALSRTLLTDHTAVDPVAEQLVLHDCGFAMAQGSCGIGANWWVRHEGETVRIEGVIRYDTTYGSPDSNGGFSSPDATEFARLVLSQPHEGVEFPDASCIVTYETYADEIVRLGESVLDFAARSTKRFTDEFDQSEWTAWQVELGRNLTAAAFRRASAAP